MESRNLCKLEARNSMNHNYFIYILTNYTKSTLYIGVTKDILRRIEEHKSNENGFAYKYNCFTLVYFEHFTQIEGAIAREKQLKKWSRSKKDDLISSINPEFYDLASELG